MMQLTQPLKIFACKLKNEDLLLESQSGGAFTAIAHVFLRKGAIVYGCGMSSENNAIYLRIDNEADLINIKGSKYVQAKMGSVFSDIEKDLCDGKMVLFSGTPCYVSAVKKYFSVKNMLENLYTVDLICHGVPSPKVYRSYLNALEKKNRSSIKQFIFRDKNWGGWHRHMEKIVYENGKVEHREDYTQLFYTNLPLRESCGVCNFSSMKRCGDFTVGDYWGVQEVLPEFDDNKGISLLFLNSTRAVSIFEEIKEELSYIEVDESQAAKQPNLKGHSVIPKNKDKFWDDFRKKGINYCISFWTPAGIPFRIKRKIRYLLGKIRFGK